MSKNKIKISLDCPFNIADKVNSTRKTSYCAGLNTDIKLDAEFRIARIRLERTIQLGTKFSALPVRYNSTDRNRFYRTPSSWEWVRLDFIVRHRVTPVISRVVRQSFTLVTYIQSTVHARS